MNEEKNERMETYFAEIAASLETELGNDAEIAALMEELQSLAQEREGIEQGLANLSGELERIGKELAEKRRGLHFNPLKIVKVNSEIANLEKLAETTKGSIESLRSLLNSPDSDLKKRGTECRVAIMYRHKVIEGEFRKQYQEQVDGLVASALAMCDAYSQTTDKARGRYGIKTNEADNFPSVVGLNMGNCNRYRLYMSKHMNCAY